MGYQPASHFSVLRGLQLIEDVKYEASRAKHLLWGQTMEYAPGKVVDSFFTVFKEAAKKGLDVKLNIDYYSLLFTDSSFNSIPLFNADKEKRRKESILHRLKSIHDLRESGIDVQLLNKPSFLERLFPAKGRNHMKIIIVDNTAWIGGINFHDFNFLCDDFMVKITDRDIVTFLKQIFLKNHDHETLQDMTLKTDKKSTLLVDGGKSGSSIILAHAVAMVNKAQQSIRFSSGFYPDGKILAALHNAYKRGLDVKVVIPSINNIEGIAVAVNRMEILLMHLRRKKIPLLPNKRKMHSKCIIVDSKKVIFGSHNFSGRGVRMGTAELAMESTDETLVKNIETYFTYLLTGTQ